MQELIGSGKYTGDKLNYVYDYSCAPIGSVAIWPVTAKGKDCVWRQIPERILSDWKKVILKLLETQILKIKTNTVFNTCQAV